MQSDPIVHVEMSMEKGCVYVPGLPAVRSLLDNWRARCEFPGGLLLGATSPDKFGLTEKLKSSTVDSWLLRCAIQVTHTLFNCYEFSVTTNPLHKMRKTQIFFLIKTPLTMATKR